MFLILKITSHKSFEIHKKKKKKKKFNQICLQYTIRFQPYETYFDINFVHRSNTGRAVKQLTQQKYTKVRGRQQQPMWGDWISIQTINLSSWLIMGIMKMGQIAAKQVPKL